MKSLTLTGGLLILRPFVFTKVGGGGDSDKWVYTCMNKDKQWQHKGGAFAPQSEALSPTSPPIRRKKIAKISHFRQIFGFCPLRIAFCPLDALHKKISGAATEDRVSKILPKQVLAFENTLQDDFALFHIKSDPLNLLDLKNKTKQNKTTTTTKKKHNLVSEPSCEAGIKHSTTKIDPFSHVFYSCMCTSVSLQFTCLRMMKLLS